MRQPCELTLDRHARPALLSPRRQSEQNIFRLRRRLDRRRRRSSSTTKALVPPRPSELTAARRRRSPAGHGRHCVLTKKGERGEVDLRVGSWKLRLGGIFPCCRASAALIRAASPAPAPDARCWSSPSRRPEFVRSVPVRNARVMASISSGSPTTVAGPVALDIRDVVRRHVGDLHGLDHRAGLAGDGRGRVAHLVRAVVVDRRSSDDRVDAIAVGDRGRRAP